MAGHKFVPSFNASEVIKEDVAVNLPLVNRQLIQCVIKAINDKLFLLRKGNTITQFCVEFIAFTALIGQYCSLFGISYCITLSIDFFLRHGLLVVLHSLHGHLIKQFNNAVNILDSITHLLLQRIGLGRIVHTQVIEVFPQVLHEILQLFKQLGEDVLMLLGKLLHKIGVRQNIGHCFRYHLTACGFITHAWILLLLQLDQIMHIHATLCKGIENYLSKFIVLDRIPIFNKMCEFVRKSSQKRIFCQIVCIADIGQACVDVDPKLVGLGGIEGTLGADEVAICIRSGFVQHNINAGDLGNGTQYLVCLASGIANSLLQVCDRYALTTDHAALLAAGLAVFCLFVIGILALGFGVRSRLAGLIRQFLLCIGQITGHVALIHIRKGHATSSHVISSLVGLVILLHILTGLVGMDHSASLSAVLFGCVLQANGLGFLRFGSFRGFLGI